MQYHDYDGLQADGIKLIRILPIGTYPNEQLQIVLENYNIDNVEFDALSYTWGPSTLEELEESSTQVFTTVERCYPVLCCGKIVLCTKALRNALRRLRTYHDEGKARVFERISRRPKSALTWADGLCINQDDSHERAAQVALMGMIYKKADQVLAFVGDSDAGSKKALDVVIKLNNLSLSTQDLEVSRMHFYDRDFHSTNKQPLLPSEWWEWVIFLSRTWFQRSWVLQEVANAFGRTTVVCGRFLIPLMVILNSVASVVALDWNLEIAGELRSVMEQSPRYKLYAGTALQWLLQSSHAFYLLGYTLFDFESNPPSFYDLSQAVLPQTRCSNPRDKVYATLGIALEWKRRDPILLPIDYKQDTSEVFTRATKHAISLSESLDLLSSRAERSTDRQYRLPTWCPDYDEPRRYPQSLRSAIGSKLLKPRWCASLHTKAMPLSDLQPLHHLNLRGRCCGAIEDFGPLNSFFNECSTYICLCVFC